MRIFLDANVLFSASNQNSHIHAFVAMLCRDHNVVISVYAHEEARRNIALKRPQWQAGFDELMQHKITCVDDAPLRMDLRLDDKDRHTLGAAIAERCGYLLTGDKKDFGHLYGQEISGVKVVSYLQLAQEVLGGTPQ